MDENNTLIGSILLISFTFSAAYYYLSNKYSFWSKRGINGPKPLWLIGNFHQILFSNRLELELKWAKEFGKVYGIYKGTSPQLVICDHELMQQVTIKDFDSFTDHEVLDYMNKYQKAFIFFSLGDHWRRFRALMSPTFTSGKIKRMYKFLDTCANDLVESFKEQLKIKKEYGDKLSMSKTSAIVDVKELYYLYTMDAITTCCYGIKMERESKFNKVENKANRNEFVDKISMVFKFSIARFIIGAIIPDRILEFFSFKVVKESQMKPMSDYVEKLVSCRRGDKSNKKFDDYLQILIDARLDDKIELNEIDSKENHHANLTENSLIYDQKKMVDRTKELESNSKQNISLLNDLEIIAGGMFLLFVGLDTTGILLTQATCALAFHKEEQEKLFDEICKIVKKDGDIVSFEYEELTSCQYLDSVIAETLRMLPPFPVTNRVATRDYYFDKYYLKIHKGMVVHLNNYVIMNNYELWHEPLKFNPERFMPEERGKIKQGTYCPFGTGPRHCLGMRFSLTEAKLALAKLIINFEFHPVDGMQFPPQTELSAFMVKPKKALVKMVPRN